jgi:hypothetical protein
MVFIGVEGADTGLRREDQQLGQEVVSLSAESDGDITRIIRRRAPWQGPRTPFDTVALQDDVILLEGTFDASFSFARTEADGTQTWVDTWSGERILPRLVKLTLRDRATGGDLLGGAEFPIRADAPSLCAAVDAGIECLSGTSPAGQSAAAGQSSPVTPSPQLQGTSP